MPVSKRRKSATKKRTPAIIPARTASTRWSLKLNPARITFIRNNPDFLTLIKIGRALNAVSFAATGIVHYGKQSTVVEVRQYRRSHLILGGYMHETIRLLDSVKGRYLGDPDFEPLRLLILDDEYRKARRYMKKVRNVAAFHLDGFDETTRRTLSKIKPVSINLACGDDQTMATTYWEFPDFLDAAFLVDELGGGRTVGETMEDLYDTILDFAVKFMAAANEFQLALSKRLDLKEYLY